MSDFDDLDDGDIAPIAVSGAAAVAATSVTCLACGVTISGTFCSSCGQKNDDLRRSVFVLGRDFLGDTFGFDSRMWRTLGMMAVTPGVVPKEYAHGKRSRFTPPVRLFLVVSFLFFLVIGLTNTLFVGLDLTFKNAPISDVATSVPTEEATADESYVCDFSGKLRFFIKENALNTDTDRLDACINGIRDSDAEEEKSEENLSDDDDGNSVAERIVGGARSAITNPSAFNSEFNSWLPRVMFFMTPVLALMLTLFIRGKDALIFDHMVLALYIHAAGFAIVGMALILAQLGVPYTGQASGVAVGAYYLISLKRTYGRGWIKTIWTALMTGFLYVTILIVIVLAIMTSMLWQAA